MFIIDESTNNDLLYRRDDDGSFMEHGHDPSTVDLGLLPNIQSVFGDEPGQIPLIPESEWDARYEEQERLQSSLQHLRDRQPNGMPTLYQNGQGYCWAYSITRLCEYLRILMGLPYVQLSGHAIGCKVQNFRNEGLWCGASAKFVSENGVPSTKVWPQGSMDRSLDNPRTWEEARKNLVTEDWRDERRALYDNQLTREQRATLLFNNIPFAADFNWWRHSVLAKRWVRIERGDWGLLIDNSHGDSFGDRGRAVLRGNRAVPNGACALRVITASML